MIRKIRLSMYRRARKWMKSTGFCIGIVFWQIPFVVALTVYGYGFGRGLFGEIPQRFIYALAAVLFLSLLVNALIFGSGYAMRIPSPFVVVRNLNRYFIPRPEAESTSTLDAFESVVRLPVLRLQVAIFDSMAVLAALLVFNVTAGDTRYFGAIAAIGLLGAPLHVQFCYLVADLFLAPYRAILKRRLLRSGKAVPKEWSVSLKHKFFAILLTLTLLGVSIAILINILIRQEINDPLYTIVFSLYVFILYVGLLMMYFYSMFKSVQELQAASHSMVRGESANFHTKATDYEFVDLAHNFALAAKSMFDYQKQLQRDVESRTVELQHANDLLSGKDSIIQKEMNIAAKIQESIIPELTTWQELKLDGMYLPMGKVSGDYYDVFEFDDCIFLLMADVSGHGVPAALITMAAKNSFMKNTRPDLSPAQILEAVNNEMHRQIKTQEYISAYLIKIDQDYNLWYSNAGHPRFIHYVADGAKYRLRDAKGLFLGAFLSKEPVYKDHKVSFAPGDRIYLFTDGLVEQINEINEEFGYMRTLKLLHSQRNVPLQDVNAYLIQELMLFKGNQDILDDITILSVERAAN